MDQVKIGKFIAQRRKGENLTQAQLAEKSHRQRELNSCGTLL